MNFHFPEPSRNTRTKKIGLAITQEQFEALKSIALDKHITITQVVITFIEASLSEFGASDRRKSFIRKEDRGLSAYCQNSKCPNGKNLMKKSGMFYDEESKCWFDTMECLEVFKKQNESSESNN